MNSLMRIFLVGLAGFVVGAVCAGYFLSVFQSSAAYSRFIADATFQIAVLEQIKSGQSDAAVATLSSAINANLLALDPSDSGLPNEYRETAKKLSERFKNTK